MSKQEIKESSDLIKRQNDIIQKLNQRVKDLELALESAGVPTCQTNAYPPPPEGVKLFQHHYGWRKPIQIHQWGWSNDFNRWRALVTFADGWYGWTYPVLVGTGDGFNDGA